MSCVAVPHVGSVDGESEKAGIQQYREKLSRGRSIKSQEACRLRRGEAEPRHLEKLAADAFDQRFILGAGHLARAVSFGGDHAR